VADPRTFHLGDILSVTTGRLVSPRHVDGLYDLLGFMAGEPVFTHQLGRVSDECTPELLRQHPDLADAPIPESFPEPRETTVPAWLAAQVERFGDTRQVTPLAAADHTSINPVAEMAMRYPHIRMVGVEVPDGR
jgi:hypothetical protein